MSEYVELVPRRNRGWPWPEDSWGLTPMYGEDGWCRSCGLPKHPQTGSIVLQSRGLTATGVWVPNWQFDVYCLAETIAAEAVSRFNIRLRPVATPQRSEAGARQIVIDPSALHWFDEADLRRIITEIHGRALEICPACGTTRWLPVGMDSLPRPDRSVFAGDPLVLASREWFGAGKQSFRQILWRRDLADFLMSRSPRDLHHVTLPGAD